MRRKYAQVLAVVGMIAGCSAETLGPNRAPVAVAGGDQVVDMFQAVEFDGSGSYDPDGDQVEYWWDLLARPEGGIAELSTPARAITELTPDAVGVWVVRLTVNDGSLNSQPDILRVQASGEPCTSDQECDDGMYCNGEESCSDGWCVPGSLDCSAQADQCNDGGCDEDSDTCVAVPKADGTGCDDGFWCTENDACAGGVCTGDTRDCSAAAAECVAGVCNEAARRCEGQPMADGDLCDDGQYCTVNSRCSGGQCQGGDPRDCSSAGGGCVDGVCDEEQDACVGDPLMSGTACNDGLFCTVNDACDGLGNCEGAERDCSQLSNQCGQGACDEDSDQCVADPINEGQPCDDGLYCNRGETCQSGFCTGGLGLDCDDSDPCTDDACNEAGDTCDNRLVPQPGNEGPFGSANCGDTVDNDCDRLVDGADPDCQECQNNSDCDDDNPCTVNTCEGDHTCLTSFVTNGTHCDDGLYCTNPDQCMNGVCGGDPLNCGGLDDQCNRGVCDEDGDQCAANPINEGQLCDDGLYCNVNETCQSGSCTGGEERDCSGESDQCNQGFCNEGLSQCQKTPANESSPCNDNLFCTDPDACSGGVCTGPQRSCSGAGDQCNDGVCDEEIDSCEPQPKPAETPCDDGFYCTAADECNGAGTCVGTGNPCTTECLTVCNDTDDRCDPTAEGTPCTDDGLYCNGPEECDGSGSCAGSGSPCPETTCNTCQEDPDGCHDPPGTPCPDDGQYCNGAEECDGSGVCDHTGDPCQVDQTCDETNDVCVGIVCSSDSDCTSGDLCRPACTAGSDGCVTPPTSIFLSCEDPVDLSGTNVSECTVSLSGGDNTGQEGCVNCITKVGLVTLDITDFGDDTGGCDADGWSFLPGSPQNNCKDDVTDCSPGGAAKDCCDDLGVLCTQLGGNYVLKTDKATNCGTKKEEWRIEKTYDFSDLTEIEVCFHVGDNNADNKQGVLVYASDGSNGPDQIFCQIDKVQPGVNDVLYPFCAALPGWADDNPAVTVLFIVHSENDGRIMYLDNISVHGRYSGCSVVAVEAFSEDFTGCPDPIGDGWNGWTIDSGDTGAYPKCPGFDCSGEEGAEADDDWMTLERSIDASALDGNVVLCFTYGDDGAGSGSQFDVSFNAGGGWKTAWSQTGDPGPDQNCREVCINLSNIDYRANRNPALDIQFSVDAVGGKIDIFEVRVEGAAYCDGETIGAIAMDPIIEGVAGTYTFDLRDDTWDQFQVDILCSWDSPPPGQELEISDSVWYQP
jgi:hypothetical protein